LVVRIDYLGGILAVRRFLLKRGHRRVERIDFRLLVVDLLLEARHDAQEGHLALSIRSNQAEEQHQQKAAL
jgi:hypothetical protein